MKYAFVRHLPVPLSETINKIEAANINWWILEVSKEEVIKRGETVWPLTPEDPFHHFTSTAVADHILLTGTIKDKHIVDADDYSGMWITFSSLGFHWIKYDTIEDLLDKHFTDLL